ncbi:MAG: hypothetical protein KF799_08915 [Bdellovibrionales bacterium]|nr:hypothetical protein [Bdellovibrionales bacterium]
MISLIVNVNFRGMISNLMTHLQKARFLALLLVPISLPVFAATGDKPASIVAKSYVKIRFIPETIQDMPNKPIGSAAPSSVRIDKTQFKIPFDLYFSAEYPVAPKFVEGSFNARSENHRWVQVHLNHLLQGPVSSDEVNATQQTNYREAMEASGTRFGLEPTVLEILPHQANFLLIDTKPQHAQLKGEGGAATLAMIVGIPEGVYAEPGGTFSMQVQVAYAVLNYEERGKTVRNRKMYMGRGEVVPLEPADVAKIESQLTMLTSNCESHLKTMQ